MTERGELAPGARVDGRYRIVGPLGEGGMGVVYRARDERLGRQVALKTLPAARVGDEHARARLVREARAAAALEHPGIAQVYDVGETEDGGAYLVMELVRGTSLRRAMGALSRERILELLDEIAQALDHAHASGVIHRDIKPDNVMVRDDGRAVLLDFGLAKDVGVGMAETIAPDTPTVDADFATKEGTLVGTLTYLAPEQARGKDVGPRSDQFALATTAYEALFGRLPWDGTNTAAVLAQILVDEAPPPSSLDSALPPAVDRVFARALAKSPAERFESATAFVRALRESFDAPEPAPPPIAAAPTKKRGGVSRIAASLIAGVGAAIALSVYWAYTGEPAATEAAALSETAVLGCPLLEAEGPEAPAGWLGAMAADLACTRITWHLGGDPARTRAPAELLHLPAVAGDDFPPDPFVAPDARERTLASAGELDGWIDGSIRLTDGRASVRLRLHARGGEVLAEAEGAGDALYIAVGEAVDALAASPRFPRRERIDAAIAPWTGFERTSTAILFDELGDGLLTGVGMEERCRRIIALGDEVALLTGEIRRMCAWELEEAQALRPPPLDESTPARLAITSSENAESLPEERVREIAAQLAEARRAERHPFARTLLAKAEIMLWQQLDEAERARDLVLVATEEMPRDWWLRVHLVRSLLRTTSAYAPTRALAAWRPGRPEAWRTLALPLLGRPDDALPFLRRAYESGGTLPLHGIFLADVLLRTGRREETRPIVARYATMGPSTQLAGEYLRGRVAITEAHLGEAHRRMGSALAELPRFGRLTNGDVGCLEHYLELARILGREHESADPLVTRLVLSEPHRLVTDQPHYEQPAIALCMSASPEVGRPCLARLRELRELRRTRAGRMEGADALLEGAMRYVEGDARGAAGAWRPLVRSGGMPLRAEVYDEIGEPDLAAAAEGREIRRPSFGGASLAQVRAAHRARAAGDPARARELAEGVVRAWSLADVPVAAVDEMRRLLEELPAPPR